MRDVVLGLAAYMIFALLVACGGTGTAVERTPATQPKLEPAPTPPAEPSAFEQRWSSACDEQGAVGQCPAPFDRPAVFVDVGAGEQAAPPFCGALESSDGATARDALTAKPSDQVLSKESLDTVVNAHASEVSACYDAALEVWPGIKGRIATSFVIWFDGQVALARTGESTLGNPMLECCINAAIRSWTFPKPKGGSIALVTFPFTLGPRP